MKETLPATVPPELTGAISPRPFEEVAEAVERFHETGDIDSAIQAVVGQLPSREELLAAAHSDEEFSGKFELNMIRFENGELFEKMTSPEIEAYRAAIEALKPALHLIDEDYRTYAGVSDDDYTHPSVELQSGVYSESVSRNTGQPHLDDYGMNQWVTYFVSIGAGTRIYPGRFHLTTRFWKQAGEEIARQIDANDIQPIELPSDIIVRTGWDTVHAAPSEEHVGEDRIFVRVVYDKNSVVRAPAEPASSSKAPEPIATADRW